jgi:RNA polymerase sigma factor (TIGR02999 family)
MVLLSGTLWKSMDAAYANRFIAEWGEGDRRALDELMALVYHELHRMAAGVVRGESTTNRTRPTALVNDLYVELQRQGRLQAKGREHFFSIAAFLMRQILVTNARNRRAQKRNSGERPQPITNEMDLALDWERSPDTLLALNLALEKLEEFDPLKARIVDLRFFADFSVDATAAALGISPSSVKRHWAVARLWLYEHMAKG